MSVVLYFLTAFTYSYIYIFYNVIFILKAAAVSFDKCSANSGGSKTRSNTTTGNKNTRPGLGIPDNGALKHQKLPSLARRGSI